MAKKIAELAKSHVYGAMAGICWRYVCSSCGADATVGTTSGPATTDTEGATRCRMCQGAKKICDRA